MMGSGPLFCSVIFFHQADNLDDVVLDDCWCALSLCGGVLSDRGGVLSDRGGVLSDRRWCTVRLVAGTLKYSVACLVERGNVCFLGNLVKAETSADGICQIIAPAPDSHESPVDRKCYKFGLCLVMCSCKCYHAVSANPSIPSCLCPFMF